MVSGTFTINGVTVNVAAGQLGNGAAADANALAIDINDVSASSGVTATVNASNELVLTAADGRNIDVGAFTGTLTAGTTGITPSVSTKSTITLSSSTPFTVGGSTGETDTGLAGGAVDAINTTVASLDVNTVTDSNTALSTIDGGSAAGRDFGRPARRVSEPLPGGDRPVYQPTHQPDERAQQHSGYGLRGGDLKLSQAQILQQASTAMVAQANTIPQNVLTLLQKLP